MRKSLTSSREKQGVSQRLSLAADGKPSVFVFPNPFLNSQEFENEFKDKTAQRTVYDFFPPAGGSINFWTSSL